MLLLLACSQPGPTDSVTSVDSEEAPVFEPAEGCPAAEAGRQGVTTTEASPYFVMHPLDDTHDNPLVLMLPGGGGNDKSAMAGWDAFFDDDPRGYRIVEPWVLTDDYPSVAPPVEAILDEVFACFGTPSKVHLLGHSNGGYLAYNVVGPDLAERFVTISGAPAYFQQFKQAKLEGIAFHNMAGEDDVDWAAYMEEAHQELLDAGFDSELDIWPGQSHTPNASWDGRENMFDFWDRH